MKLSHTMEELIAYMREHGGVIDRRPGGFWGRKHYGTSSVRALVTRGVAEYSEWKEGRSGRFPVQAKLTC